MLQEYLMSQARWCLWNLGLAKKRTLSDRVPDAIMTKARAEQTPTPASKDLCIYCGIVHAATARAIASAALQTAGA